MIDKQCLTLEWINAKRTLYQKADPSIMERVIFALYLLEQLTLSELPFVFKGGTSLILLLNNPQRFSIDIDIIVPVHIKQPQIEAQLSKILEDGVFIRYELDNRRSFQTGIPKAHYRFIYSSEVTNKEQEILLDILFEDTHYSVLIQKTITSDWIKHQEPISTVTLPDINSITGDKLTAYAPNTIGILYNKQKEREIIKQLFDVGTLFDQIDNLQTLKTAFTAIANTEITYSKNPNWSINDVLDDIIETGLILANRDKQPNSSDQAKYKELETGIKQFNYFLFTGSFRVEEAQTASAKAAYLAAIIKTNYDGNFNRFDTSLSLSSYLIEHPSYNFLNRKLKHVPHGALYYWHQTIKLLHP